MVLIVEIKKTPKPKPTQPPQKSKDYHAQVNGMPASWILYVGLASHLKRE